MAKVQKVSYSAMKSAWLSIVIVRLEGGVKPMIYQSPRSCFISKRFRYEEREGKRDHHPGLKNASHLWSHSIEKQEVKNINKIEQDLDKYDWLKNMRKSNLDLSKVANC